MAVAHDAGEITAIPPILTNRKVSPRVFSGEKNCNGMRPGKGSPALANTLSREAEISRKRLRRSHFLFASANGLHALSTVAF